MFIIDVIETSSLGDRSYVATDGEVAVVVDPQRDIDRVVRLVEQHSVRVTHVLETHVHNDYVTGGLELARDSGATYVLPAGSGAVFDHVAVGDGDVLEAGQLRLRALHTPGHTRHHMSYALADAGEQVRALFSGGSMLFGATGRTDLVSPADTDELTRAQYRSVQRLARELPAEAGVFPTHGFGSFCSVTPTSGTASTVGEQQRVNPALTLPEQEYVDTLLAGLGAYPAYYARMAPVNRSGPPPLDLSPATRVDPAELRHRIEAGEWVVDLRDRTAFAAGHLAGALNFELGTSFATYLGWLYRYGEPLVVIGRSEREVAEARRELARIGIDEMSSAAGDVESLVDGSPLRSYRVSDFAGLAEAMKQGPVQVLDTRRGDERVAGHVAGSQHIPLHDLAERLDELPPGEVWVHCASGYRASIAASMLDAHGRQVVLVDDSYSTAQDAGLAARPVEDADVGSGSDTVDTA